MNDARILMTAAVAAYSTVTIAATGGAAAAVAVAGGGGAFVVCICCCSSCFFRYWVNTTSSENQLHFSNRERKFVSKWRLHSLPLSLVSLSLSQSLCLRVSIPMLLFFLLAPTSISRHPSLLF